MQVMWKVPAFGNTMVFESPGLKATPLLLLRSLGAPVSAANCPCMPMTRSCVRLLVKFTDWPALIVTVVGPEKLNVAKEMVAARLGGGVGATGVGWAVSVGAGVAGVAVGLVPRVEELPPHAASRKR